MKYLLLPHASTPGLIALVLIVHFSFQIIASQFYPAEIPIFAGILYVLSGGIDLLVAAHMMRKSVDEKKKQFLYMGVGLCVLGITFMLAGLGIAGFFGLPAAANTNLGMYLLIIGTGTSAGFFLLSPTNERLHEGPNILLATLALLVVGVIALYQLHHYLPALYTLAGTPTLWRQQLVTIVLFLFAVAAARFAFHAKEKTLSFSTQWNLIGISVLALVMLNFLLSTRPGDEYSWAGRFFHVLASGAFIQYLWWDEQGE